MAMWQTIWRPLLIFSLSACGASPGRVDRLRDADGGEAAATCVTSDELAALTLVNEWREVSGAPALLCGSMLNALAHDHALYLAANENELLADGHHEDFGSPWFTGATLAERVDAHGIDRQGVWISEGVGGGDTPAMTLATQMATVYHRSPLFSPAGKRFAYASAIGSRAHVVMNVLTSTDVTGRSPLLFPFDGMSDVPTAFAATGERPDPLPMLRHPGFPISIHFPRLVDETGTAASVHVTSLTLTNDRGESVPARILTRASDPELFPSDVFLVPESPLSSGSRYVVQATLEYGQFQFERRWRFSTVKF